MKIDIDMSAGAIYVQLLPGEQRVAETREVTELINLDLTAGGDVIGVEILTGEINDMAVRTYRS